MLYLYLISLKYEISFTLEYDIFIYLIFTSHTLKIRDLFYIRICYIYISFLYLISLKYEISFTLEYHTFISHIFISYSNINQISHYKDVANCITKKSSFWIAAWRWLYQETETCRLFNYILITFLYNEGCERLQTFIQFINVCRKQSRTATKDCVLLWNVEGTFEECRS